MSTRRRIASVIAGAALVLGLGMAGSGQAATIVCPPGCVLAGAVKATGGQPDPTSISLYGTVDTLISTFTGDVANVASVGGSYYLNVYGSVARGAQGTLSGNVTFHASRWDASGYSSFGETVAVSGTMQQLKFEGPRLKATLTQATAGAFTGTVLYAEARTEVGVRPVGEPRCTVPSRLPSQDAELSVDANQLIRLVRSTCTLG